jgi:hypothetical protein
MTLTQEERRELEDAFPPTPDRTLTRIRAQLQERELEHLQRYCVDLDRQLQLAKSERMQLINQLATAEQCAAEWRARHASLIKTLSSDLQSVMSQIADLRASARVAGPVSL